MPCFSPLKFRANFPFAHTPWPNPSAPDWQGNPIPTLPARSVGSCSSPNKSQLPSSGCFTIKVSRSPLLFFSPFPADGRLHSPTPDGLLTSSHWRASTEAACHERRGVDSPHRLLLFLDFEGKKNGCVLRKVSERALEAKKIQARAGFSLSSAPLINKK